MECAMHKNQQENPAFYLRRALCSLCSASYFTLYLSIYLLPAPLLAQSQPAASTSTSSTYLELDKLRLLALSVQDKQAVLLFPDKKMLTLAPGDALPATRAVLRQILSDKIVLDEGSGADKQLVWLHLSHGAQAGKVERFGLTKPPALYAQPPKIISLEVKPTANSSGKPASTEIKP
jgi:hypothetical protein